MFYKTRVVVVDAYEWTGEKTENWPLWLTPSFDSIPVIYNKTLALGLRKGEVGLHNGQLYVGQEDRATVAYKHDFIVLDNKKIKVIPAVQFIQSFEPMVKGDY